MRPVARDRQAATDCGGWRDGHNGSDKAYRLWTIKQQGKWRRERTQVQRYVRCSMKSGS